MMQNWRHTDFKYVVEIQKGFVKQSSQSTLSPKVKKVSRVAIFLSIDDLSIFCRAKITTVPSWNCNRTSSPKLSYLSSDATAVRKMTTNGFQRNIIWKKTQHSVMMWFSLVLLLYFNRIQSEVKNTFMKEFQHADFQIGMNSKKTKNLRLFGVDFYSSNKSLGASLRSRYRRTTISHWMTFSK